MKLKVVTLIGIIMISFTLSAMNKVKIHTNKTCFQAELLCASDSLLYIWTGLNEFDETQLKYVTALPYSEIVMINLRQPYSWGRGIAKIAPYALAGGAVVVANSDLYERPTVPQFSASSIGYGLVFAIPGGLILSAASEIPKKVKFPDYEMFRTNTGKYRKYLKLTEEDSELIKRIIKEVK